MAVDDYIQVSDGSAVAWGGGVVPNGVGFAHILYDPQHSYTPPKGVALVRLKDFAGEMYVHPAPVPDKRPIDNDLVRQFADALGVDPAQLVNAITPLAKAAPKTDPGPIAVDPAAGIDVAQAATL